MLFYILKSSYPLMETMLRAGYLSINQLVTVFDYWRYYWYRTEGGIRVAKNLSKNSMKNNQNQKMEAASELSAANQQSSSLKKQSDQEVAAELPYQTASKSKQQSSKKTTY